jgi:hypothetical protein
MCTTRGAVVHTVRPTRLLPLSASDLPPGGLKAISGHRRRAPSPRPSGLPQNPRARPVPAARPLSGAPAGAAAPAATAHATDPVPLPRIPPAHDPQRSPQARPGPPRPRPPSPAPRPRAGGARHTGVPAPVARATPAHGHPPRNSAASACACAENPGPAATPASYRPYRCPRGNVEGTGSNPAGQTSGSNPRRFTVPASPTAVDSAPSVAPADTPQHRSIRQSRSRSFYAI